MTATFWVGPGKQRGIEFHGQDASLYLATWGEFDSRLELSTDGERYSAVPLVRDPYPGIEWSRPLADLAEAIARGRPHRASAEHAAHVVEVLGGIAAACAGGGTVEIHSQFTPPEPMEWAR